MEMFINDLSFQGQCESFEQAVEIFTRLVDTIISSNTMRGNTPIRRTRNLKYCLICSDKTTDDFVHWLFEKAKKSSKDKDVLTKVLHNIVSGPFIQLDELEPSLGELLGPEEKVIKDTGLHAALCYQTNSIPAVISATNAGGYSVPRIQIDKGSRLVINLCTVDCHLYYKRTYEPNPKHEIRESKVVQGNLHSKMDLSSEVAQHLIDNGILIEDKKSVFSYHNDCWYKFFPHSDRIYHGFPIGIPTNDLDINRIIKEIGPPPYSPNGYKVI